MRAVRDDDFGKATIIETSGGGVEKGEDLQAAVCRELKEELGAEVEIICKIGVVNDFYNLIHIEPTAKRYYCYDSLASSVLGFTGSDNNGLYGLEYQYDKELSGTNGVYVTARDSYGNEMPTEYESYIDEIDGYKITLTLNLFIQSVLENQLRATFADNGADDDQITDMFRNADKSDRQNDGNSVQFKIGRRKCREREPRSFVNQRKIDTSHANGENVAGNNSDQNRNNRQEAFEENVSENRNG